MGKKEVVVKDKKAMKTKVNDKSTVKMLDKAGILNAIKFKTEAITIPEGTVIVSELSARDYSSLWEDCTSIPDPNDLDENGNPKVTVDVKKFNALLLVYSIIDEDNKRIFDVDDVDLLMNPSQTNFMPILIAAKRLNGLIGGNA